MTCSWGSRCRSFRANLAHRDTTLNSAALLANLGMTGGEGFSSLESGPVQPVAVVNDFSSFATERFEPRAVAAAIITYTLGNAGTIPAFKITSLGAGGIVIDDLKLEALVLGSGPAFGTIPEGAWIPFSMRDIGSPSQTRYPITGGNIAVLNAGGVDVRSPVAIGHRDGPGSQGVFLAPDYQLQPGAKWYVPAGYDLVFQMNSESDGAGTDPVGSVQIGWREILGIGTGGFAA